MSKSGILLHDNVYSQQIPSTFVLFHPLEIGLWCQLLYANGEYLVLCKLNVGCLTGLAAAIRPAAELLSLCQKASPRSAADSLAFFISAYYRKPKTPFDRNNSGTKDASIIVLFLNELLCPVVAVFVIANTDVCEFRR